MFFKQMILFVLFVLSTGCGKWYGEEALPVKFPKLNSSQTTQSTSCQIDLEGTAQKYLQGTLQSQDIHSVINCAVQTIDAASDKIVSKNIGQLTLREISVLLEAHVLGNPEGLMLWLKRLFSFRDILLGEKQDVIGFSEVKEMLLRVDRVSDLVPQLSLLFFEYQKVAVSKDQPRFWELRKKMFSLYMRIIKEVLKNQEGKISHTIPKDLILKQYQLWDQLEEEIGSHYIQAGYLANQVLLGHEGTVIKGPQVEELLTHLEFAYHQVCDINSLQEQSIWTPQETLFFLNAYERLLEHLFSLFLTTDQNELKKEDLIQLLELLYASVQGKATEFVDAVLSFKKQIVGGSLNTFGREEMKQLMVLFHDALAAYRRGLQLFQGDNASLTQEGIRAWLLENKNGLSPSDFNQGVDMFTKFPKTIYLWTTPFEKRNFIYKNNFLLTQIAGVLVDRAIQAYDTDHDGKLSLKLSQTTVDDFSEIDTLELTSLTATIQKLLKGLDLLTEGELSQAKSKEARQVWTDPLSLDTVSLGKIITLLSDQLLYTSNGDQTLDRYEILEAMSFILENSRAATWFFRDVRVESFYADLPESQEKGLKREGLLDILKEVLTLQWYFPDAMRILSPEELKRYVGSIIALVGRQDPQVISVGELESVFALVRLIETFFIRYDQDGNGILDQKEVRVMYHHFSPLISKLMKEHRQNSTSDTPILSGILECIPDVFTEEIGQSISEEKINRKVFEYIVAKGEFPEDAFDLFFPRGKIRSDRLRFVRLFATIFKELKSM
ncbi:MAG: hypothetical protein HYY62_01495 [Deltaproteobacteria bacterium]|nr:hypothetical protein [Deltaproteobacteria bacterium]